MPPARPKSAQDRIDFAEIQKLVELIEKSPITEFELVENDLRIRISKNGVSHGAVNVMPQQLPSMHIAAPHPSVVSAGGEVPPSAAESRPKHYLEIKSPMVGTFYRAPSPDTDPYVRVGDVVEPGKVVCIVEAMKLMNELEAEVRGRIIEILVENAQPVEFGQVLFRVDPSGA